MILNKKISKGFTLIELMVTISIIAILSALIFASFDQAREQSRDKVRMSDLKTLQLALEVYKAQNGQYPDAGCSAGAGKFAGPGTVSASSLVDCDTYIVGLVPDYIPELPTDPNLEDGTDQGYFYRSDNNSFKIIALDSVEDDEVTSFDNEFSRCPTSTGCSVGIDEIKKTYAVYSIGAENW